MKCNIDARGKAARMRAGIVTAALGLIGLGLGLAGIGGGWMLGAGVGLLLSGGFAIFEARAGWCAVRAMGFRTPV
ncbi:MAG: hypothetical protein ACYTEV_09730 [Planctomycetota bacterium]|jgi:hypothetical protein